MLPIIKQDVLGTMRDSKGQLLLDIAMFSNAQGGILLIGVPEARDASGGQPTGIPDPAAPLGIAVQNPESLLLAYGSSIEACVDERLHVESHAIPIGPDRFVLAFKVPNSTAKPHCVRYKGHIYFPCRRERHRGTLDIREIKDMAMHVSGQLERAEALLTEIQISQNPNEAVLHIALIPVFSKDFMIDIGDENVRNAFGDFHVRTRLANFQLPAYSFEGLRRRADDDIAILQRNGMIETRNIIRAAQKDEQRHLILLHATAVDVLLRNFVLRAQQLARRTQLSSPFLMRTTLWTPLPLVTYDDEDFEDGQTHGGLYKFPSLQVADLFQPFERIIRPFCDMAHQIFGNEKSPCFDAEGRWIANF